MARKKSAKRKRAAKAKKKVVSAKEQKTIDTIHLVFEILVAVGFAIGIIPFGYLFSMWWVIPMALVSMMISVIWNKKTLTFDIVTFVMAMISLVPVLGYIGRIVGLITAVITAKKLF